MVLIVRFRGGNEDAMCRGCRFAGFADPFPSIPLSSSILRSIFKGDEAKSSHFPASGGVSSEAPASAGGGGHGAERLVYISPSAICCETPITMYSESQ